MITIETLAGPIDWRTYEELYERAARDLATPDEPSPEWDSLAYAIDGDPGESEWAYAEMPNVVDTWTS